MSSNFLEDSSEVEDALLGFLEPPPLPLDTLFQASPCNAYFQETCFFSQHVPNSQQQPQQPQQLFSPDILLFLPPEEPQPRGALSAQSAAARERRKRISQKTLQLSLLIPGGNRMNTAEMLHSAHKYIKFLQAQVGILDLMSHIPETESAKAGHLTELLTSPAVQEKLSSEGMCIVPQEIVDELTADSQIKSKSLISAFCSVY